MQKKALFVAGCISSMVAVADRPAQPNFVVMLADDLGWQDVKVYDRMETGLVGNTGGTNVFETPYIDTLATEGVLFTQAYSPAPTCAPSRCGMMSGKYPARINKTHVQGGECPKPYRTDTYRMIEPYYSGRLDVEEITIPEALAPLGYFSGHIGKWHMSVSHNSFPQPEDQGFDWTRHNRGITLDMEDRATDFATTNSADLYQLDENGFAYDQTTEDALDFLSEAVATNQPFFCYYATWLVHTPIQIRTESLLQKYCEKMDIAYPLDGSVLSNPGQQNPYYAAMVETLDYSLHRIMTYLKTTDDPRWPGHKLIENTYVFFTSDNGGCETAGPEIITDNFPLDMGKKHAEEGGTRVPLIVVGPNVPTNRVSDVMVNGLDLYPTLLSLAGEVVPERLDGCDLSNLLTQDVTDPQAVTNLAGIVRDTMYWHYPHGIGMHSTIRKNGWKLFRNYDFVDHAELEPYRLYKLYETNGVRGDIEEAVDLVDVETDIAEQLAGELNQWLDDVNASLPHYNPNYAGTLSHQGDVPVVLDTGNSNGIAWVTFAGSVERAELIYTLNGDGSVDEEWFNRDAAVFEGYAEAVIPDGTTHYLFNLMDTNNFLISSVDVGQMIDGVQDSTLVPPYIREPEENALLLQAGMQFPTAHVVISNSVGSVAGAKVKDNDTNSVSQAAGQTFTVTEPVQLTQLTLKVETTKTFPIGEHKMALWIGTYSNNAAGVTAEDTRVFEWIDFSGVSITNDSYLTFDFTDTVFQPGTYAFQLAWPAFDAEHLVIFCRDDSNPYANGDRLYKAAAAGTSVLLPFSDASAAGMLNKDLVFALHRADEEEPEPGASAYARTADGNWSDLSGWKDNATGSYMASSTLPGSLDTVIINNNYMLNLDTNATVSSVRLVNNELPVWVNMNSDSLFAAASFDVGHLTQTGSACVVQSAGTLSPGVLGIGGAGFGTVLLSGGILDMTQPITARSKGLLTVNGGTLRALYNGETRTLEGPGQVKIESGSVNFSDGGTDRIYLNSGLLHVSGGSVYLGGQVRTGNGSDTEFRIVGTSASVDMNILNQQSTTAANGTFRFVLDERGVSPVSVSSWMHLEAATLIVDGSNYLGGPTNMLLFDSENLISIADTNRITVSGFSEQGLAAEVVQDQTDGKDWVQLVIMQSDYGAWAASNGFSGVGARMSADPDGNGRDNLMEYATGAGFPRIGKTTGESFQGLEIVYYRRRSADCTYTLEAVSNLAEAAWSTNGLLPVGSGRVNDEFDAVTNRILYNESGAARLTIEARE